MPRRERRFRVVITLIIVVVIVGGGWWFWPRDDAGLAGRASGVSAGPARADSGESSDAVVPEVVVVADTPAAAATEEVLTPVGPGGPIAAASDSAAEEQADEPGLGQISESRNNQTPDDPRANATELSRNPRIQASLQRYRAGEVLAARQELNRMLVISRDAAERAELRRQLEKIADATIFSRELRANDALTDAYTIQPGDVLINIGKQFSVPHEVIMMINGIEDPKRIRAGRKIKVPRGPFRAKIYKSQFRLDVYLQDLYLRSFPVALGADRGTPEGEWKVKDRLPNPTYYPPAAAEVKRIIPPDDPTNPLGEHWIGLEGTAGDAVGHEGYGIHGTIEPESIGQAVSLGCVRMHNDDVAFLYSLMIPGHSKVTILP